MNGFVFRLQDSLHFAATFNPLPEDDRDSSLQHVAAKFRDLCVFNDSPLLFSEIQPTGFSTRDFDGPAWVCICAHLAARRLKNTNEEIMSKVEDWKVLRDNLAKKRKDGTYMKTHWPTQEANRPAAPERRYEVQYDSGESEFGAEDAALEEVEQAAIEAAEGGTPLPAAGGAGGSGVQPDDGAEMFQRTSPGDDQTPPQPTDKKTKATPTPLLKKTKGVKRLAQEREVNLLFHFVLVRLVLKLKSRTCCNVFVITERRWR